MTSIFFPLIIQILTMGLSYTGTFARHCGEDLCFAKKDKYVGDIIPIRNL